MSAVAAKLIEECQSRGISLRPGEGGKLKVSPPPERLPAELREELKRHKPELLRLLTTKADSSPTSYRSRYKASAESVREECFALDPHWLIDQHPELWTEMKNLDEALSRLEEQGEEETLYRQALARLVAIVRKAQALYHGQTRGAVQ